MLTRTLQRSLCRSSRSVGFVSPSERSKYPVQRRRIHTDTSRTSIPITDAFSALGIHEPTGIDELTVSPHFLKKTLASIRSHDAFAQEDVVFDTSAPDLLSAIPTISQPPEQLLPRRTYLREYLRSKSGDYTWALRQKYGPELTTPKALRRFQYFEDSMHKVNDYDRAIVSVEPKVVRDSLREFGISIFDPRENVGNQVPVIKRYHVIAQEFFGILSTTTFHGQSLVMPSKEMIKFTRALLNHYLRPSDGLPAFLCGFSVPQKFDVLKKTCDAVPTDLASILDLYFLYTIPPSLNNDILSTGVLNPTTLDLILDRLQIPHSEANNAGNKAYFTLLSTLKLLNPYDRHRLKLDSHKHTLDFHEKMMLSRFTRAMKNTHAPRDHDSEEKAGFNKPATPIITARTHKEALTKLFES